MKELKVNISLLFITVILLLNCNVFYLIENVNSDCILIVVILFVIHSFIITIKCKKQHKSYFTPNILFIVILVITSAIAANRSYNQSVWLGIRPQRMQLIWFFSYFALARLMSCNKLKFSKVEKIIYIIGILELFVFSAFWISKGKLSNIIHMPYDYRYSAIRLRGDVLVIIFLFILALNNYLQGKDKKKNLVILIVIYLFELFCVQTRLVIIALSIALITIFILWKKSLAIKICCIPVIIIAIMTLLNTQMGQDLINNIINNNTDGSYEIRKEGKEYYLEDLKKSMFIGRGFINIQHEESLIESKIEEGYNVNDNGVIGFLWLYGMLGAFWIVWTYMKLLKISWKAYKIKNNYIGLIWCVLIIILSPNIIWWWWRETAIFEMLMSITLCEKICERKGKYK